jgi:hypothetical protein
VKLLTLLFALTLTACGTDSGSSSGASDKSENDKDESESTDPTLQSISLELKSDLPKCEDKRESQLAYVKSESQFYVCESGSWSEIDIEGEDGVTTEVEATNKKNQWVDPISGLTWLIGGSGTYAQAQAACSGSYRLPTWAEAITGITHGVRGIAASIPQGQDFWIDISGQYWYATVTAGQANKYQVLATATYNIYCVK